MKQKEKNQATRDKRVGETSKQFNLAKVLYNLYAKGLFKSFGSVQSRSGGTGRHTSLISWRPSQGSAGSNFQTKIPSPAHELPGKK